MSFDGPDETTKLRRNEPIYIESAGIDPEVLDKLLKELANHKGKVTLSHIPLTIYTDGSVAWTDPKGVKRIRFGNPFLPTDQAKLQWIEPSKKTKKIIIKTISKIGGDDSQ